MVKMFKIQELIATDHTGKFPMTSSRGSKYIMVLWKVDGNAILVATMKNQTEGEIIKAYLSFIKRLKAAGIQPKKQILNNEASKAYKEAIKKWDDLWVGSTRYALTKSCWKGNPNNQGSFCGNSQWGGCIMSDASVGQIATASQNDIESLKAIKSDTKIIGICLPQSTTWLQQNAISSTWMCCSSPQ